MLTNVIKVMVAEDHPILRQDFCEMIAQCPHMELTGSAASGSEIVNMASSQEADIILMDIEMEKYHDGIEAASAIAAIKPKIGIIFLTVHEDDETVYQAYSIPSAKDYIVKTADHEKIIQRVTEVFEEQKRSSPSIASKIQSEFSRLKQTEDRLLHFMQIVSQITQAEKEIIELLLANRKISEIALMRNVELVTIKSQISTLLKKFNMNRTKDIVNLINRLNLSLLFRTADKSYKNKQG